MLYNQHKEKSESLYMEDRYMAGQIFYRERQKIKKGSRNPRFRIIAVSGPEIKIYGNHFRKKELEQIAKKTNTDLVELKRDKKSKTLK
jgi:hypothetical protein